MVVALIALFISLGGVSYGVATGSIDSRELKNNTVRTKDLRNNDVRSKDIRNSTILGRDIKTGTIKGSDIGGNTVTGRDVLESSLGVVPNANLASFAGSATNANRANSAAKVDQLKTVGSFKRVASSASNADPNVARTAATEVPLFAFGTLSVYGKCFTDSDTGLTVFGEVYIRTKTNGAVAEGEGGDSLNGNPFLDTNTAETARQLNEGNVVGPNAGSTDFEDDATFGAAATDGTAISGEVGAAEKQGTLPGGSQGVYGAGNACVFWGHAIS